VNQVGAVGRLLLVVALAVGVASMHTLGHPHGRGHGAAAPPSCAMSPEPPGTAPMASASDHAVTAAAATGRTALHCREVSPDPLAVCLAILLGFALVALIAALAVGCRSRVSSVSDPRTAVALAGRGPPWPVLVGLRLADLSVLRT
jgi:hypothetical protein